MPVFRLTLQRTYHDKGFFNVGVDFERFVRKSDGPVLLQLGKGGPFIQAKVNRAATPNGTPRIFGGVALRDWFFKNFEPMDIVNVDLTSLDVIVIEAAGKATFATTEKVVSQKSVAKKPVKKPALDSTSNHKVDQLANVILEVGDPAVELQASQRSAHPLRLSPFIRTFAQKVGSGELEIYNEFSLQHELGVYLRSQLVGCKVQFERNVSHFGFTKAEFEKREIDITVTRAGSDDRVGVIELKYPRNGQIPEAMYSFCKDIVFLEQLVASGFQAGYFLVVADDPLFYQGSTEGIYGMFRGGRPITGIVAKPTGAKDSTLTIRGSYVADWVPIKGNKMYCLIEIG